MINLRFNKKDTICQAGNYNNIYYINYIYIWTCSCLSQQSACLFLMLPIQLRLQVFSAEKHLNMLRSTLIWQQIILSEWMWFFKMYGQSAAAAVLRENQRIVGLNLMVGGHRTISIKCCSLRSKVKPLSSSWCHNVVDEMFYFLY